MEKAQDILQQDKQEAEESEDEKNGEILAGRIIATWLSYAEQDIVVEVWL